MSVARSIEIKIRPHKLNLEFTDILMTLASEDTIPLKDMKSYTYLPCSDKDQFNWQESNDLHEVFTILNAKEKNHESLGFTLYLDDEDHEAITVSVFEYGTDDFGRFYNLYLNLGIGKRLSSASRYTDFSWYLERFVSRLEKDCHIGFIKCEDIDGC